MDISSHDLLFGLGKYFVQRVLWNALMWVARNTWRWLLAKPYG